MTGLGDVIGESEEETEDVNIVAIVQCEASIKGQVRRAKHRESSALLNLTLSLKIGRASCRERV